MALEFSAQGVADLSRHEGRRNRPYEDQRGHCTVGVGHLLHMGNCTPDELDREYSDAEVDELLRGDLEREVSAVNRHVTTPLTQRQFDALVNFAHYWGTGDVGGFPATSVLRLVNERRFAEAADELLHGRGPVTTDYPQGRPYDKDVPGTRGRLAELGEWLQEAGEGPLDPVEIIRRVAADLERWGVQVVFVDGWEDRGRPYRFEPGGAVWHHTATRGYDYDYPSLGIVRDGRDDLPGPLAQFGVGRHTAAWYVIAAGTSNHAGPGGWEGLSGNTSVWGCEVENDGVGEEFSPAVLRTCRLAAVSLGRHTGYGPSSNCEHYEWSSAGKIDRNRNIIDGDAERAEVARLAAGGDPEGGFLMALSEQQQTDVLNATQWNFGTLEQFVKPALVAIGDAVRRLEEQAGIDPEGRTDIQAMADAVADELAERLERPRVGGGGAG